MNPASVSGDCVSTEILMVEKVSHHSIELSWRMVQEDRSGPTENWTHFSVEQMDPKTRTYDNIYTAYQTSSTSSTAQMDPPSLGVQGRHASRLLSVLLPRGYSTHHIVEDLQPCTMYQFRLRINRPNGECCLTPAISASTFREPPNSKHLHQAVNRNDEEELSRVLQSGTVNVNVCDKLGLTPLMVAAQKGFTRMVHKLLEHGADIHKKNGSGKDALMLACFAGHLDIVKHLHKSGATWESQDMSGCTPLHWAVDGGLLPIIDYMIQGGCEVDVRDTVSQWTPLMRVSAVSGNSAVASVLIQAGANVNVQDKDGKTPLMLAVLNNHEQLVKLLLDSGADGDVKNQFGLGIAEMASALGKQNIIDLLEGRKSP